MALAGLLSGLKITAEQIGELWDQAPALVEFLKNVQAAYPGSQQFAQFVRFIRLSDPTATFKDVSPLYQASKFFADQLLYLGRLSDTVPIDRRLATPVQSKTGLSSGGTPLRYRVTLVVNGLPDGVPKVFNPWVGVNYEISRQELLERAKAIVTRNWKPAYLPASMGGEGDELEWDMEINAFERFYI